MKKIFLVLFAIFSFCATVSWGQQKWNLTPTMTGQLGSSGWLAIVSTADSESMPNFSRNNPGPWKSPQSNFGVRIVGNITSIGESAFDGCVKLGIGDGISLPSLLKSIGNYAFRGCTSLKGAKSRYENANGWKNFKIEYFDSSITYNDNPFVNLFTKFGILISRVIGEKALTLLVLFLSVILFFMRILRKKDEPRQGTTYIISNILFLTVCALEIMYVAFFVDEVIWFCIPDQVGWLWTIVNFVLLGGVVYNQILYFFDVLGDVFSRGNGCNIRLGLYSLGGGFICALLCSFFYKDGISVVFILVGILQLIQSILIFRSFDRNIKGAFFAVFVYLFGMVGTVIVTFIFTCIVIVVVIGLAVLWLVLKLTGFGEGNKGRKGTVTYSDGTSEKVEETGRGILGETYYKGKDSGNEFREP